MGGQDAGRRPSNSGAYGRGAAVVLVDEGAGSAAGLRGAALLAAFLRAAVVRGAASAAPFVPLVRAVDVRGPAAVRDVAAGVPLVLVEVLSAALLSSVGRLADAVTSETVAPSAGAVPAAACAAAFSLRKLS